MRLTVYSKNHTNGFNLLDPVVKDMLTQKLKREFRHNMYYLCLGILIGLSGVIFCLKIG